MNGKNRNDSKVLVTGGAGFIGSNLCESLLKAGYRVVCLDNFSTGKPQNIEPFRENPRFTFIEGDIRDLETCRRAVEGVDYVLHQAALGSVPRSLKDPITTHEVNISGFLHMLVAARDAGVKRFVYASSSSVYGDSPSLPKVEDAIGTPLSPYALTKYADELYAGVFARNYGMQTIGLRYFNVFGPRQDPEGAYAAVIPLFIRQLIALRSPVINGGGEYSRDFTYVDNAVQANMLAMLTPDSEAVNRVYNVACGQRTTLNELVDELKKLLGVYDPRIVGVPVEYGPYRAGDVPHSLADIGNARELLGYVPRYDFGQGLALSIDWYWKMLK